MAKKKKKDGPFNPYFGKFEEESHMPEKPFFMWMLIVPGLILGCVVGLGTHELVMGLIFGAVMGMASGSLIDKKLAQRREKKQSPEQMK